MQKRICPSCLTRWYSSDSTTVWKCENCGHAISVPSVDEELFKMGYVGEKEEGDKLND